MTRREMLRRSCGGAAGLLLADLAGVRVALDAAPAAAPAAARAKAVIQIWLWGGPSHLDTFDPKPDAGAEYCGPLAKPIPTSVDGILIGELLPELAKRAGAYSIIRSMTHGDNGHETAAYRVQTGRQPGDGIVWPGLGAVISYLKGDHGGLIPPYVVLTQLQGRFSESGFLGLRYKPFATGGDPSRTPFAVEGVVAEGVTERRQMSRREFFGRLDTLGHALKGHPLLEESARADTQAYELILGETGKVFDLAQEKDEVRDRYGRNTLGQSCLAARRLVEKGVVYVTVNAGGWDTHKDHFPAMRQKLPQLDAGVSALLDDLRERGLLDTTIVWVTGEFGRTPRVDWQPPWNGGRGHFGPVFSALVAGGGFKGGRVVGASDAKGETVKERPVYPCDLIGSVYELMGIDPEGTIRHPDGRKLRLTPTVAEAKTGGRLRELTT